MSYVFISYAREDKQAARNIQLGLERVGVEVWWDEKLQLGQRFEPRILEALENADAVLVLWSADSVTSEWVQREALIGLERGVLLQLLLDDVYLPGDFADVNGVDLTGWTPGRPHTEFNRLVQGLRSLATGEEPGKWEAERLAQDTLLVRLDQEQHTVQYAQGRVFVDGHPSTEMGNAVSYDRSFNFDLSDGSERYVCRLDVRVSAFKGSVKRMTLSIGGSVIYDA